MEPGWLKEFQGQQTRQEEIAEGRVHSIAKAVEEFLFSRSNPHVAPESYLDSYLVRLIAPVAKNSIHREKIIVAPAYSKNKAPTPMTFQP